MVTQSLAPRGWTPATVPVMGLPVAAVSERQTIDFVIAGLLAGRGGWICTANLEILRQWRDSAELRHLVASADLVVADGMPLVWAGGLQGSPLPERVCGSALINSLTSAAADVDASIFLLGGNPGTADGAAAELTRLNPGLRVVGTLCPPLGFDEDPDSQERIAREVTEKAPDIVFVALGFPKQEWLITKLRSALPHTWFVPCGISFSFVSGEIHRAPPLVQRLGLEWLHRMVQEPRRLYRRYVIHGLPFLFAVLWSSVRVRVSQAPSGAGG